MKHHMKSKRIVNANMNLLKHLLMEPFPTLATIEEKHLDEEFVTNISKLSSGCAFINVSRNDENKEDIFLPIWKGIKSVSVMISKEVVHELLYRIFGIETSRTDNNSKERIPEAKEST